MNKKRLHIILFVLLFLLFKSMDAQINETLEYKFPPYINKIFDKAEQYESDSLAFITAQTAIDKSKETTDIDLIISSSLKASEILIKRNSYLKAKTLLLESLHHADKDHNEEYVFKSKYYLAHVERRLLNFESVVIYATDLLPYCDNRELLIEKSNLLFLVSEAYYFKKLYDQSLKYCDEAKKIFLMTNDSIGLFNVENQYGLIKHKQKLYNDGLLFFERASKLAEEIKYERGMAMIYNNMAMIKFELGEYHDYLPLINECIEIQEKLGDIEKLATGYNNIGYFYYSQNKFSEAIFNLNKSVAYSKKAKFTNRLAQAFDNLSMVYFATNDYKKAYEYKDSSAVLEDSLSQVGSKRMLTELTTKYEMDSKELQIENLNKENALKNAEIENSHSKRKFQSVIIVFFGCFLIIGAVLTFFLYRLYHKKNSLNKLLVQQKNAVLLSINKLKEAKEEIETQHEMVISHKSVVEEQKKEIDGSISYAYLIQKAILGGEGMITDLFKEAFIFLKPLSVVSGDFYWFGKVGDNKIVIAADCTGHGVPGAFMTVLGHDFLEEIIIGKGNVMPDTILYQLDEKIYRRFNTHDSRFESIRDGMDISVLTINEKNNHFYFSGAKNPLLIAGKEGIEIFKGSRNEIGGKETNKEFTLSGRKCRKGETYYLFSDGFQDQFGGENESKYKTRKFRDFLFNISNAPLVEQEKLLIDEFNRWKGSYPQTDDILIIGVRN